MNDKPIMTHDEVKEYLPHRYPFLYVDTVLALKENESIRAIKNITNDEPFFQGHFPGKPVMPGVIMVEALAQAGGVLMAKSLDWPANHAHIFFLAGVDNARFKRVVLPGDQLILDIEVLKIRRDLWKVHGKASVSGELACSADIMMIRGS